MVAEPNDILDFYSLSCRRTQNHPLLIERRSIRAEFLAERISQSDVIVIWSRARSLKHLVSGGMVMVTIGVGRPSAGKPKTMVVSRFSNRIGLVATASSGGEKAVV